MNRNLNIVALEILEGCNLTCDFCVRNALNNLTNKVSLENFEKLLNMLNNFPQKPHIAFTGGEPFLQKDLLKILEMTVKYGFKFSITTNATIKNREVIDFCAKTQFFKHFIISIDSYNADVHNNIRGPKALERTLSFIDYLREKEISFGINATISEVNYFDVDGTIKFAKDIGAKDISVATVKPNGRGAATLNPDQLDYIAKQILNNKCLIDDNFKVWAAEVTLFLYDMDTYRDDIMNGESGSCAFGRATLHIRANGDILGCTSCEDIVLGNVFDTEDDNYLNKLWHNHQILNDVRSKQNLNGTCGTCEFKEFCGGCRCRAYGITGDLFGDDNYCPIVIENNKEYSLQ
ncbi:TPA: radical SAM protein [Bacillus cereus]|uniref:radical SAM/SPASM domain-containing protein n=1 Tax=Bacillus cereus group TaxID=86661 RepID=UPI0012386C96|nr:radical SAM protein [Bacillus cereus]KAA6458878.1 radical SAM protein [Bacillus cereus]KAB2412576.1 radical SAM protein [Bacillus cereus]KAB2435210.1 radical SAM protein [Bacillus cereus]KAB2461697.1 radical SAM protein [Bacillus cereus]HDR8488822.1 radical SAM protein [Bacillus cereus]